MLEIYLQDVYCLAHPDTLEHPSYCYVNVLLPKEAKEDPPCHYPKSGAVGTSTISTGLSYGGIGFSITSPSQYVTYSTSLQVDVLSVKWEVDPSTFWGSVSGPVFTDYCEFTIGFQTPLGYKPWAYVSSQCEMYAPAMPAEWWPDWTDRDTQLCKWLYLDPPGSDPVNPGNVTVRTTPQTLYNICLNRVQTCNYAGTTTTEVQRGSSCFCWVNYSWGWPNATQQCFDLRAYDSQGTLVGMSAVKLSYDKDQGLYLAQAQGRFGVSLFISKDAALGQATIICRILPDWSWVNDTEYSRETLEISITG